MPMRFTGKSSREVATGLMEVYLSSLSHRTNEIMRVLTIFAAVFIPLTLIAGVYGMNFNPERSPWNMPELGWRFGYPFALALMGAVAGGMLLFFRRRGWLESPDAKRSRHVDKDNPGGTGDGTSS